MIRRGAADTSVGPQILRQQALCDPFLEGDQRAIPRPDRLLGAPGQYVPSLSSSSSCMLIRPDSQSSNPVFGKTACSATSTAPSPPPNKAPSSRSTALSVPTTSGTLTSSRSRRRAWRTRARRTRRSRRTCGACRRSWSPRLPARRLLLDGSFSLLVDHLCILRPSYLPIMQCDIICPHLFRSQRPSWDSTRQDPAARRMQTDDAK